MLGGNTTVRTRNSGSSYGLSTFNPFTTKPIECPQGDTPDQCSAMGANWQQGPNFGKAINPTSATNALGDLQMPRIALGIEYDGSAYSGWQQQAHARSVQAELERALTGIAGHEVNLTAAGASRLILVAGKPLGEPIAQYGPFVMNTKAELAQAFEDYQAGRLGTVPAEHIGD